MKAPKITPAPWRIGNLASYDGYTGQPYRNVWAGKGETETVVARAIRSKGAMTNDVDVDATAIAAVPDLIEALIDLEKIVKEVCTVMRVPLPNGSLDRSKAALLKAGCTDE